MAFACCFAPACPELGPEGPDGKNPGAAHVEANSNGIDRGPHYHEKEGRKTPQNRENDRVLALSSGLNDDTLGIY